MKTLPPTRLVQNCRCVLASQLRLQGLETTKMQGCCAKALLLILPEENESSWKILSIRSWFWSTVVKKGNCLCQWWWYHVLRCEGKDQSRSKPNDFISLLERIFSLAARSKLSQSSQTTANEDLFYGLKLISYSQNWAFHLARLPHSSPAVARACFILLVLLFRAVIHAAPRL